MYKWESDSNTSILPHSVALELYVLGLFSIKYFTTFSTQMRNYTRLALQRLIICARSVWRSQKLCIIFKGHTSAFFDYFAWNKENGKNWDHWVHSLTHIFVYSQGTVLICQGNTFRCGR